MKILERKNFFSHLFVVSGKSIGKKNTHKHVVSTPKNVTLLKIRFGFSSFHGIKKHKTVCCSWEGNRLSERERERMEGEQMCKRKNKRKIKKENPQANVEGIFCLPNIYYQS